ncbi:hypothetical protein HMPREF1624_07605 [Sporothrix schenckii ATCC 58251]|uniref:Uncharacterized protein n=1 Tax=Sporothrix schenckii (strain ATCC 58251 / de Perez 2211183) TaxID=1391915 RepID=U7PMV4_SPOS1|nr:hypothetical protein HMPREF1624_07605 [Sporothrix schenckii ATCC 58251]
MAATDGRMGAHPQPYPNLPASPTLTNPDMILPDYDFALSPSLDDEDHPARSQSPLMMWKNAHAASSTTDLQQLFAASSQEHHAFPTGPITPTTPIIYGNGTMLSDIGEVTEAESTPGRPSPGSVRRRAAGGAGSSGPFDAADSEGSRTPSPTPLPHNLRPFHHIASNNSSHNTLQAALSSRDNLSDAPRRSSPTIGVEDAPQQNVGSSSNGVKQRARQQQQQQTARRDSLESNSTIRTQDQAGLFADFDDTVSVGDSVFQGDDEESVAESYVEEPYVAREVPILSSAAPASLLAVPDFTSGGLSSGGNTSDEGDRRLSAASLSLRAEKILANAKKRLTTMEGNLNRARSSLYISSPPGGSLPSDGSTPSPKTPVRSATASSRYHDPNPGSPIHSRMVSDGAVPINGGLPSNFPQRSASALGAAGGYRKPQQTGSRSADRINEIQDSLSGGYHRAGLAKPVDIVLERLDEVDGADDNEILPSQDRSSDQVESFLSPTFASAANGGQSGLTRSASVAQMRDLKDQMKGLKGKISTLREQARADSLKRRSLQSLRTPSPFTHSQVDQWYAEQPQSNGSPESSGNGSPGQHQNNWTKERAADSAVEGNPVATRGDVSTPPPRQAGGSSPAGSARLQRSGGSSSSSARQTRRNTATALDADQTDGDSVLSRYEDVEDGEVTKLSYANMSQHATESPVLGEARSIPGSETIPGDDDVDDMRTENGDFSDDGEPRQLEDVFVDSAEATEQLEIDDGFNNNEVYDLGAEDDDSRELSSQQQFEQDDVDYESESGESLYHEALQHPVSHEDREDAFDYEHFILHSALGTISQQRLARSGSFSSEDSVETTRGPVSSSSNNNNDAAFPSPNRRTSMSSISTVESADSFATATEGRTSRSNHVNSDEEDDVVIDRDSRTAAAAAKYRPDSVLLARAAAANQSPTPAASAAPPEDNFGSGPKRNSAEEPRQTQQPSMARRPASAVAGHRPSISSFESIGTTRSFPLVNRNRIGSVSTVNGGPATGYRSGSSGGTHSLTSSVSTLPNGNRDSSASSTPTPTPTQAAQPGLNGGLVSSDNEELRSISEIIMNETASIFEQGGHGSASIGTKPSVSSLGAPFLDRAGSAASSTNGGPASHAQAQALEALSKEDQYLVERLVGNLGRCVLGLSESGRASTESRMFRRRIDAARRILEGLDPI